MQKEKEIQKEIDKIEGTMQQEGFDLNEEIKDNIKDILIEESTVDIESEKITKRYGKSNER